ncbi:hypothetical protein FRB99_007986 [Tulasnella sp. 403]|nr:hypothetical protein FRB99_007986 [Tulasnella sp. 403]
MVAIVSAIRKVTPNPARRYTRGIRKSTNNADDVSNATPHTGEQPEIILRVQVVACSDLIAKDKGGTSDPFVVVQFARTRFSTPVVKRSLNPSYPADQATFDFHVYRSNIGYAGALEFVVWDKDYLPIPKKEYLGEVAIPFDELFKHREPSPAFAFEDPRNTTHGIGTAAEGESDIEDDGLSSADEYSADDLEMETSVSTSRKASGGPPLISPSPSQSLKPLPSPGFLPKVFTPTRSTTPKDLSEATAVSTPESSRPSSRAGFKRPTFKKGFDSRYNFSSTNDVVGIVMLEIQGAEDLPKLRNMTRTGWDMDPFCVISFGKKVFRTRVIRHSLNPVWNEKLLFHVHRLETNFKVEFRVLDWDKLSGNDQIGNVSFDLPELVANVPQPDPETKLYPSEVTKGEHDMTEYKLPIVTDKSAPWEFKHSPVLKFRAKYQPYRAIRQRFWRQYLKQYDMDNNELISRIELTSMLDSLGSTLARETVDGFFTKFNVSPQEGSLTIDQVTQCLEEAVHKPMGQRKRVNIEDQIPDTTGTTPVISESPSGGTMPNLELDFSGPAARPVDDGHIPRAALESIPIPQNNQDPTNIPISKPQNVRIDDPIVSKDASHSRATSQTTIDGNMTPVAPTQPMMIPRVTSSPPELVTEDLEDEDPSPSSSSGSEDAVERVINIKTCPLCHRPRMNSKAETDIITHLAVCASTDWARVDRMIVGNYVTPNQAQRKWYSKVITKVSAGAYELGANSANIIVQNRATGQLEEEKMQGYVRLGIRLLYKGAKSRMEGGRGRALPGLSFVSEAEHGVPTARKLLKSLSIKQGAKYDSPESAREILPFIAFHRLPVEEILDPLDSFKTFNEFFYRKLKPEARPLSNPDDPSTLVSVADCRMMAFESVQEATRIWIKGREFTVGKLLGDQYKDEASRFAGGALGIFRLAPQDYHRFHVPVDGKIGKMTYISGEYYTVNPQAIRTTLDVYGDNARKIVPIDSPTFGRVMAVCIGAMMVGSIVTTVDEGAEVKRGDEFGYFAFGGSTIVLLFEKGAVAWDEDLAINGRAALETLISLVVISDIICPWCYIGYKELDIAIKRVLKAHPTAEIELEYRPFLLDPKLNCKEAVDKRTYFTRKFGEQRLKNIIGLFDQRGKELGIKFGWDGKIRQTTSCHRLLLYAFKKDPKLQVALLGKIFEAYFEQDKDVGEHELLATFAEDVGVGSKAEILEFLASDRLLKEIQVFLLDVQGKGITGVPCTVINQKYAVSGGQTSDIYVETLEKMVTRGEVLV